MKSGFDSTVVDNMSGVVKATIHLAVIKTKKSPLIEFMQKKKERS